MIDEDIKKLVIARLEILPPDKKISIGSIGEFTKEQLIQSVKNEDAIGKKMIQIELEFLQALKHGILTT
ncbi:hypothetical protein HZA99_02870 [Candidatus Woesearchaeota archaeon]|nr:hypothetical protein [Candidatus Woesearchaeota archaeon]